MSMHKLSGGSGYDYLTRQVAALDATSKGHVGLASYYTERGESPGVWVGSGMAGIDGPDGGDPVAAEQMRNLFGHGMHPLAEQRQAQLGTPELTKREFDKLARLGTPFKNFAGATPFQVEIARRLVDLGRTIDRPVEDADRAGIRTEVARDFFRAEHGRDPVEPVHSSSGVADRAAGPSRGQTRRSAGRGAERQGIGVAGPPRA